MNLKHKMGLIISFIAILLLSSCVTLESLKKVPDEKLKYYSGYYAENMYRKEIVRRHPEWPEKTRQAILRGSVRIGMTKQQARAAWGEPYKVNRTVTQYGTHEQWVYGISSYSFLYFDDDILTSIQN